MKQSLEESVRTGMEGISISEINDAEVSNDSELTWFQRFEI